MLENRPVYQEEHQLFRDAVRGFIKAEVAPHFARWEEAGIVDRSLWTKAGAAGLLCPQVEPEYGGAGGTFRHNAIVVEEFAYAGFAGPQTDLSVHSDVCAGYLHHLAT
ncbi:MAG TPA: acyl-CoA dehydrogenase family protein, partial [Nevskiaceae bacterium]|nr:acyl-CoA dehydrogenase family protein [Nevskiaceae bacterium]